MDALEHEIRAAAHHLCNIVSLLRLKMDNKAGTHRVAQALMDMADGRIDAFTILDLVDQEENCREVERRPTAGALHTRH